MTAVGTLLLAAALAMPQDSFPKWGLGPIAGYSGTTGIVGGAQVSLLWPRTILFGEISGSTRGAITFGPRLVTTGRSLGLDAQLLYEKQLESEYYGPGNGGDPDTSATYDIEQQEAEALLTWRLSPGVSLGVGLAARNSVTFDRQESPLWDRCPTELTGSQASVGPRLSVEWLGEAGIPFRMGASLLHQEGSEASYSQLEGQLAAYLPLGPRTALAARGRLQRHFGTESTPFPYQLFLGSLEGLRGYRDGRFSGSHALLCGVELRQEVLRLQGPADMELALGLVAFGDAGQVADGLDRIAMDRFHASGGLGIRVLLPGDMVMAIDGALSPEGFGLATGYGHTF